MRKTIVALSAVLSAVALSSVTGSAVAQAADGKATPVVGDFIIGGTITSIEGKTLTLAARGGSRTISYDDDTEIVSSSAPATAPFRVGDAVSVRIVGNAVVRIEVRPAPSTPARPQ
jgi:hypothetical protein